MDSPDVSEILYFAAIAGGPIILGLALAFALITRRRRGRLKTPGELQTGLTGRPAEPSPTDPSRTDRTDPTQPRP